MDQYEKVYESLITLGLYTIEHTIDNYLENARDKGVVESWTTSSRRRLRASDQRDMRRS